MSERYCLPSFIGTFPDYLVRIGKIRPDQQRVLTQEQKKSGRKLDRLLVDLGFLTPGDFVTLLSGYSGFPVFNESDFTPDMSIIHRFSAEDASKWHSLPIRLERGFIYVVMVDPLDIRAMDHIYNLFPGQGEVCPVLATEPDFMRLVDRFFPPQSGDAGRMPQEDTFNPVTFANNVIEEAVRENASDIHLEPDENMVGIRIRVDGILRQSYTLHRNAWSSLCVRLKVMAGMDIAESRVPQDGRFTLKCGGRMIDFRMASHPTVYGENLVIRILDKHHSLKPLEDLGFDAFQVKSLKAMSQKPEGIIILTGPTGSGKTTTLYSLLGCMKTMDLNIMTLEEPVEYEIQGIRQTEVRESAGITFASGIRSILRQDPDIILVGEVRDMETAQMVVRAAMTGHLVLTTLHATDVFGTIHRFLDFGVSPSLLAGNLLGVVSQRLVRKSCEYCGKQGPDKNTSPCLHCDGKGYRGRIAVGEILEISEGIEAMIAENRPLTDIRRKAHATGFKSLREQGEKLVAQGLTSASEIQRVIR